MTGVEVNIAVTGLPVFDEANCGFPTTVASCPDSRRLTCRPLSRVDKMSFSNLCVPASDVGHTPVCKERSARKTLRSMTHLRIDSPSRLSTAPADRPGIEWKWFFQPVFRATVLSARQLLCQSF